MPSTFLLFHHPLAIPSFHLPYARVVRYERLELADNTHEIVQFDQAFAFIVDCLEAKSENRLLVHCAAGSSRSGAVAVAWKMKVPARFRVSSLPLSSHISTCHYRFAIPAITLIAAPLPLLSPSQLTPFHLVSSLASQAEGLSFDEALARMKNVRPLVHPNMGFVEQLKALEKTLRECRQERSLQAKDNNNTEPTANATTVPALLSTPCDNASWATTSTSTSTAAATQLPAASPPLTKLHSQE